MSRLLDDGWDVVARPTNEMALEERTRGVLNDSVLSLLLKAVQSLDERHPGALPLAVVQSIVSAPPIAARPAVTVMPLVPVTVPVATPLILAGGPEVGVK